MSENLECQYWNIIFFWKVFLHNCVYRSWLLYIEMHKNPDISKIFSFQYTVALQIPRTFLQLISLRISQRNVFVLRVPSSPSCLFIETEFSHYLIVSSKERCGNNASSTKPASRVEIDSKFFSCRFGLDWFQTSFQSQPTRFPYFSLLLFRSSIFHDLIPKHVGLTTRKQNLIITENTYELARDT